MTVHAPRPAPRQPGHRLHAGRREPQLPGEHRPARPFNVPIINNNRLDGTRTVLLALGSPTGGRADRHATARPGSTSSTTSKPAPSSLDRDTLHASSRAPASWRSYRDAQWSKPDRQRHGHPHGNHRRQRPRPASATPPRRARSPPGPNETSKIVRGSHPARLLWWPPPGKVHGRAEPGFETCQWPPS